MNALPVGSPESGSSRDDDPRLAFVYQEAVRGLVHQQSIVDSLNNRAGNLIFATASVTSLLGTRALADGVGFWDWVALVLLFLIGMLTVFMLWPYYNYTFRFDPEELLDRYVDGDVAPSIGGMYRTLAMRIKADMLANWRIIQPIRVALQISLVFLLLEIAAWLLSIGRDLTAASFCQAAPADRRRTSPHLAAGPSWASLPMPALNQCPRRPVAFPRRRSHNLPVSTLPKFDVIADLDVIRYVNQEPGPVRRVPGRRHLGRSAGVDRESDFRRSVGQAA